MTEMQEGAVVGGFMRAEGIKKGLKERLGGGGTTETVHVGHLEIV